MTPAGSGHHHGPHHHDHADSFDDALLADTIHNLADALTALPIGLAFWVACRPPNRRYTYGCGRAEDLAGLTVVVVMAGAAGVALGWRAADPVIGLLITVAILAVLRGAVRDIYRRLMDAVDPALVDRIEREVAGVPSVLGCDGVRVRWIGHELHAELNITVDGGLTVRQAHDVTEDARHHLLHHVGRLADAIIHVNPPDGAQAHARTAHHRLAATAESAALPVTGRSTGETTPSRLTWSANLMKVSRSGCPQTHSTCSQ